MTSLFIPGRGTVDTRAWRVDQAVNEYDERLLFAKNEETGDWCVFVRMPGAEPPYPVCGFGRDIPSVDDVMVRIRRSDTMRNGDAIYKDLIRSQEKYRAELKYNGDQATDESVEVVEHFMRKHGKSPIIKSFSKGVSNDAG
jgi:hypothetical protein